MPRMKAPEGETPLQKFQRTAGGRTGNIVALLEVLAGQASEVPDDAFVDQACGAIRDGLAKLEGAWRSRTAAKRKVFEFRAPDPKQAELPQTAPPQKAAAPAGARR